MAMRVVYVAKFAEDSHLNLLKSRLEEIARYEDDWNGLGSAKPAQTAVSFIRTLLANIAKGLVRVPLPRKIVASAYGSVSMIYTREDRKGYVEAMPEAVVVFLWKRGREVVRIETVALNSEIGQRMRDLCRFVKGDE